MSTKQIPTPEQIEQEYGGRRAAALELGVTTQAIGLWFKNGRVPPTSYRRLARSRPRKWKHLEALAPA